MWPCTTHWPVVTPGGFRRTIIRSNFFCVNSARLDRIGKPDTLPDMVNRHKSVWTQLKRYKNASRRLPRTRDNRLWQVTNLNTRITGVANYSFWKHQKINQINTNLDIKKQPMLSYPSYRIRMWFHKPNKGLYKSNRCIWDAGLPENLIHTMDRPYRQQRNTPTNANKSLLSNVASRQFQCIGHILRWSGGTKFLKIYNDKIVDHRSRRRPTKHWLHERMYSTIDISRNKKNRRKHRDAEAKIHSLPSI